MRTSTILVCLFLACASFVCGQQCGQPSMTLTGQSSTVSCTYIQFYTRGTITTTSTFADKCTNSQTGSTYYDTSSTNTGSGQCETFSQTQMLTCPAIVTGDFTTATSPSDYNRFYNRAYGQTIVGFRR